MQKLTKMSVGNTYSREQLQGLQAEHKREQLFQFIEYHISNRVITAAKEGKTEFFWRGLHPVDNGKGALTPANQASPWYTNDELIKALLEKFPGTSVGYQETWEEVRPGVKEQRKGILINWS